MYILSKRWTSKLVDFFKNKTLIIKIENSYSKLEINKKEGKHY